jgi:bifunctional DNA-binding transcriptional regulator/antitoxin component of YhaV-PrlF toxin-antitoxin module
MAGYKNMENNPEHGGMSEAPATGFEYKTAEPVAQPQHWTLKLGKDGRLVIPAAARAAMDISSDGQVTAVLEDGTLKLFSPATAWRKIDEIMKPYRDPSRSMVDELIADRRAEAAAEDARD